jgi:hypothetical protein
MGMYTATTMLSALATTSPVIGRSTRWAPDLVKRPRKSRTALVVQGAFGV